MANIIFAIIVALCLAGCFVASYKLNGKKLVLCIVVCCILLFTFVALTAVPTAPVSDFVEPTETIETIAEGECIERVGDGFVSFGATTP